MQAWPSTILMICRHSIECTILRDFLLDHILLGQIELKWVSDCFYKVPLGTRGHSLQEFGQDYSVSDHTCPADAQSSDGEKHTNNSEWQNGYGVSHEKETKRSLGLSFHESRTADIYNNQTGTNSMRQFKKWL